MFGAFWSVYYYIGHTMEFDWDDLRVFLAVARKETLSAAAISLRVSQPTVGRRLNNLEENLSARLFERLPTGFVPTTAGIELLPLAEEMEQTADAVLRRQATFADQVSGTVRISAYDSMAQYLVNRVPVLRKQLPEVELEFSVAHLAANLSRREADLQIRECLPDSPGLISRKLGGFAYAIYGSKSYVNEHPEALSEDRFLMCDWVGMDDDHVYFPGQKWMRARLGQRLPAIRSNNAIVLHDTVKTGVGLGVLPCFAGDSDPVLHRLTPPIDELFSTFYLLVHDDLRRVPAVRAVMDALVELFQKEEAVLSGEI
jgi:DNA-binding transcriptional LysR family regulator